MSTILINQNKLEPVYLIIGELESAVEEIKKTLIKQFGDSFISASNPDFSHRRISTWGVEDSRELKAFQSYRPINYPAKVFLLIADTITSEAQNALLKTLEEPSYDTHFFIFTKRLETFLPTIISRCRVVDLNKSFFDQELVDLVKSFLTSDLPERFVLSREILKKQEEKQSLGIDFLNCLLEEFCNNSIERQQTPVSDTITRMIVLANRRGSSLRLILEHLSLVVPML